MTVTQTKHYRTISTKRPPSPAPQTFTNKWRTNVDSLAPYWHRSTRGPQE